MPISEQEWFANAGPLWTIQIPNDDGTCELLHGLSASGEFIWLFVDELSAKKYVRDNPPVSAITTAVPANDIASFLRKAEEKGTKNVGFCLQLPDPPDRPQVKVWPITKFLEHLEKHK